MDKENKGTVAYKADTLLHIIDANEKVIKPIHESLSAEWKKWDEESKEEMDRLSSEINVDTLKKRFKEIVAELSEDTTIQKTDCQFLWFKWTNETVIRNAAKLEDTKLHEAVLKALVAEQKGKGEIVYETKYIDAGSSFAAFFGRGHPQSIYLSNNHSLGYIHPDTPYMYSYTEFMIKVEGTILSPDKERYTYSRAVAALDKLRTLAELPDSELITLSDELSEGLDWVISTTRALEE